jgi:endoglucanase
MPSVYSWLATQTGDDRWRAAAAVAVQLVADGTGQGHQLPPDWATLNGTHLTPIAAPSTGSSGAAQYSLDAVRVPIWFAAGCTATAKQLAASWWTNLLASDGQAGAQALSLTGQVTNGQSNPVALLAAAAAAQAAGDRSASAALRARAEAQANQSPTYYGDAWIVLANALADGSVGAC